MCTRGIPQEITNWIARKLTARRTTLLFDDYASPPFNLSSGIDQGCTLSVICFQFYNADLADIAKLFPGISVNLKIDNSMAISVGNSFEQTTQQLCDFMIHPDGTLAWAATHNCIFALDKFGLLNFK